MSHAGKDHFGRGAQAEDEAGLLEIGNIGRIQDDSAARGNDEIRFRGQLLHEVPFQLAEVSFAVRRKDFGDGSSLPPDQLLVHVDEVTPEGLGDGAAG